MVDLKQLLKKTRRLRGKEIEKITIVYLTSGPEIIGLLSSLNLKNGTSRSKKTMSALKST